MPPTSYAGKAVLGCLEVGRVVVEGAVGTECRCGWTQRAVGVDRAVNGRRRVVRAVEPSRTGVTRELTHIGLIGAWVTRYGVCSIWKGYTSVLQFIYVCVLNSMHTAVNVQNLVLINKQLFHIFCNSFFIFSRVNALHGYCWKFRFCFKQITK